MIPQYLINGTIFEKILIEHKIVFKFSLKYFSETFFILWKIEQDVIKNVYWSLMQSTRYYCSIWTKLGFFDRFSKNTQIKNFMKICLVGAELFHANNRTDERMEGQTDRQTDMTKLIFSLGNSANTSKNHSICYINRSHIDAYRDTHRNSKSF
jgi:hypothetical protein